MKKILVLGVSIAVCAAVWSGCKKGIAVECTTKMRDVSVKEKGVGATFTVNCPANCAGGSIWGTDTYTTDSAVCMAGIHAGVITKDKGGMVKVTVVKGLDKYSGSDRNGVKTADWNRTWGDTAYQVSKD